MRHFLSIGFLLFCLTTCQSPHGQGQEVDHPYDWLVGKWQRTGLAPGKSAFESWTMTADLDLKGRGVTLSGKDTSFVESLQIMASDGDYYYVADVDHNPAPVRFKIQKTADYAFRASNPAHDFPKYIDYELKGEDLSVHISDDSLRRSFTFVKFKAMVNE